MLRKNELVLDLADLQTFTFVCKDCSTEITFNIAKQVRFPDHCPVCLAQFYRYPTTKEQLLEAVNLLRAPASAFRPFEQLLTVQVVLSHIPAASEETDPRGEANPPLEEPTSEDPQPLP